MKKTNAPSTGSAPVIRAELRKYLLFASVALGVLAFFFAAGMASGEGPHSFDNSLLRALRSPDDPSQPIGPSWLLRFMTDITAIAGWPVIVLLTVLLTGFLAIRRNWPHMTLLLAAVIGESVIVGRLKHVFARERPDVVPHLVDIGNYSFPSGHSASAAAVYLTLAAILARSVDRRRERLYIISAAILLALLIGASRVYLGVHYPSDVLAGWSFGAAWASLIWLAAERLRRG